MTNHYARCHHESLLINRRTSNIKRHLLEHGGLILLDGLDEVPETNRLRPQIKQAVEGCTGIFPRCRMVVTSRTYAYQHPEWKLSGFAETVLSTFTERQIRVFVGRWYEFIARFRGMSKEEYEKQADELNEKILSNARLRELAERPLLLTLMTSLHASRGKLPEKRVELYQETVGLLLHRWEWRKFKRKDAQGKLTTEYRSLLQWLDVDRDKILKLLGELAYEAHSAQPAEQEGTANIEEHKLVMGLKRLSKAQHIDLEQIETHLRDRAGLLVSPDEGVYTFPHRSFQEYLAACQLTEDDYPRKLARLFRNEPNRWREVLLLAAAKVAGGSTSFIWPLVKMLCWRHVNHPDITPADAWGALLAGQVLEETFDIDQIDLCYQEEIVRIRHWLAAILTEQVPADEPLPAVERALAGNILAQLGDPRPGIGLREDGLPDILWRDVPAGTFLMGSDPEKDKEASSIEQPQHEVRVSAFRISRYPVTNAQYRVFVEDGGYTEKWRECWTKEGWKWKEKNQIGEPYTWGGVFDLPNHPVVVVTWYEVSAFCQWLTIRLRETGELTEEQSVRLPAEAEWEKAARGSDGRIYPWGRAFDPNCANYEDTGLGATSAVGCFPDGASPYGCEDMAGNVWEWCLDVWHKNYEGAPTDGSAWKKGEDGDWRVVRGGSWAWEAEALRCARRDWGVRGSGFNLRGFRVLCCGVSQ